MLIVVPLIVLFILTNNTYAENEKRGWRVDINNKEVILKNEPRVIEDTIFVPANEILELLGFKHTNLNNQCIISELDFIRTFTLESKDDYYWRMGDSQNHYIAIIIYNIWYYELDFYKQNSCVEISIDNKTIKIDTIYKPYRMALNKHFYQGEGHLVETSYRYWSGNNVNKKPLIYNNRGLYQYSFSGDIIKSFVQADLDCFIGGSANLIASIEYFDNQLNKGHLINMNDRELFYHGTGDDGTESGYYTTAISNSFRNQYNLMLKNLHIQFSELINSEEVDITTKGMGKQCHITFD